jgi:hypothetical protein
MPAKPFEIARNLPFSFFGELGEPAGQVQQLN